MPAFDDCDRCGAPTQQDRLIFDDRGRQLCPECHAQAASAAATRTQREGEEYRRCPGCGSAMAPEVVMGETDTGDPGPLVRYRSYTCRCGHHCRIAGVGIQVIFGAFGAVAAFSAGKAYQRGDSNGALAGGLFMAAILAFVLFNVWQMLRHPRVR